MCDSIQDLSCNFASLCLLIAGHLTLADAHIHRHIAVMNSAGVILFEYFPYHCIMSKIRLWQLMEKLAASMLWLKARLNISTVLEVQDTAWCSIGDLEAVITLMWQRHSI